MFREKYIIQFLAVLLAFALASPQEAVAEEKSAATIEELVAEARELQGLGNAENSLPLLNQALEMASFAEQRNVGQIAEILSLKGMSYSMKFEWAKAIKLGESAIRTIGLTRNVNQFPEVLYNLASYYAGRGSEGDYEKALNYIIKSRDLFDKRSRMAFYCNNNIVYYYVLSNQSDMAYSLVEDAVKSGVKVFADDRASYIKELWNYATMMSELDNYRLATYYANACLRAMEEDSMSHSIDYVRRTIKLAGFYYQQRDFLNEINTLTNIVQISKEMDGEESTNYVDCLRKLALAYNHQANEVRDKRKDEYEQCMQQNEHYEELSREILIRTGNIYEIRTYQIPLISNQANQFFAEKKYPDAINYEQIAYTLYKKENDSINVARTANNLANYYYNYTHKADSALVYSTISVDIYDKTVRNTRNKGLAYHNMGIYSHASGNLPVALQYQLKAVKTFELAGDTLTANYVNALGNAGIYSKESGNLQQAGYYSLRSAEVQEKAVSYARKEAQAMISRLPRKQRKAALAALEQKPKVNSKMVIPYWNKAMTVEAADEVHDAFSKAESIQRDVFIQDFPDMDAAARQATWDKHRYVFDYAETLAFSYHSDDALVIDAFNALLVRDAMPEFIGSANPELLTKDWKAVADGLDDGTALVRFFLLNTSNMGDAYSAFVLCKGWSAPRVAYQLFTDADLDLLNYDPLGGFKRLFDTESGRTLIANEGRFGRMVWKGILAQFAPAITTIKYHSSGIGILDTFDPSTYALEEKQDAISGKYKMVKF